MTCDRCGAEDAELGLCPPCNRHLCVTCYDGDQEGKCQPEPLIMRDDAIRALRGGGMSRDEVAEQFGLTLRTISRVTNG